MSLQIIYPFNTPSNYSYDTDEIEVTGGKAKLKLQTDNIDFTETFDNDTGFTYDSAKAEFTGGLVRQKDQRNYSNALFEASYNSVIDGTRGLGVLTGTPINGATITGSKLDLTGGRSVNYDADLNADSQQTLCVKFKATPNFSGAPPTDYPLITICKANGDSDNIIMIRLQSNGQLQIFIQDSTGAVIINSLQGAWNNVAGTRYEFGLNVDITSGETRLFVENKVSGNCERFGSTLTDTGTRDASIAFLNVGGNYNNAQFWDGYIEDLVIFSSVQNTTDYAADGYSVPDYLYAETPVVLPEMEHTGDGTIETFNSFVTSEGGSPRYLLQIGRSGDYLYWDGAAWSVSDETYAQANDATTFNTNCVSLPVSGEDYGQFMIIFPDSNTQSYTATLTANMNVDIYSLLNPIIIPASSTSIEELVNFASTITASGSDAVKFTLAKGSSYYYWNGSAWAVADGTYTQTNTVAEIVTNIATFTTSGISFKWKAFLHSNDGTTTPEIDNITVDYDFYAAPETINKCIVWGYNINDGNSPDDSNFTIQLSSDAVKYKNETIIRNDIIIVTPDSNTGYWEIELIETENMEQNNFYIFDFGDKKYYKYIPNEDSKNFWSLINAT